MLSNLSIDILQLLFFYIYGKKYIKIVPKKAFLHPPYIHFKKSFELYIGICSRMTRDTYNLT